MRALRISADNFPGSEPWEDRATDPAVKKTYRRLALLVALLLLYPLAVISLRLIGTGIPAASPAVQLKGDITSRSEGGGLELQAALRAVNSGNRPVFVDTLIFTAMQGETPVVSLLVESAMLSGRWEGSPSLAPGQEANLGIFTLLVPEKAQGQPLLVTLKVTRKEGSGTPLLAQCDLEIPPPPAR